MASLLSFAILIIAAGGGGGGSFTFAGSRRGAGSYGNLVLSASRDVAGGGLRALAPPPREIRVTLRLRAQALV
jgi:hypothetical protein